MDLSEIRGHEVAKRALEVAAVVGCHLSLIGPPHCGAGCFREAADRLGVPLDFEFPCPCGWRGDLKVECRCTPRRMERHLRWIDRESLGMWTEVLRLSWEEVSIARPGETTEAVLARVRRAREQTVPVELDGAAGDLGKELYERLALTSGEWFFLVEVATAIARLAGSDTIRTPHLAEAVQYRPPVIRRLSP